MVFRKYAITVLFILTLFAAGCDMWNGTEDLLDIGSPSDGASLILSLSTNGSRTALPDFASELSSIAITITHTVSLAEQSATIDPDSESSVSFNSLDSGTYSIYAEFFSSDGTAVATASENCSVTSGNTTWVDLSAAYNSTSGTGDVSLEISWPSSVAASGIIWAIGDSADMAGAITAGSLVTEIDISSLTSYTITADGLDSDAYYLYMKFLDADGHNLGVFIDSVNIYAAMTTDHWLKSDGDLISTLVFTEDYFKSQNTELNSLQFFDDSGLPTDTQISFSDGSTVNLTLKSVSTLGFCASFENDGRNVDYDWNGSVSGSLSSGELISSLNVTSSNILILTVTAPDGGSAVYSYHITPGNIVSFDTNGGSWTGSTPAGEYGDGSSLALPVESDLNRSGFTLTGWEDRDMNFYSPGDLVTINDDYDFTAVWTESCTIYYYSGVSLVGQESGIIPGEGVTLSTADGLGASHGSFKFAGWDTDPNAETSVYFKDEFITDNLDITMGDDDLLLYAVWTDGTPVRTLEELESVSSDLTADYVLTRDIDISLFSVPLGDGGTPFSGSFDGLNHTFSKLNLSNPTPTPACSVM